MPIDKQPAEGEPAELLPNPKWIRGFIDGTVVIDSRDVLGVWDHRHYPSWYFPIRAVSAELRPTGETDSTPGVGIATIHDLVVGDRTIRGAARIHPDSPIRELRDRVKVDFAAIDSWFEEDVEVFSEPKNPYVRLDALPSSRHVIVAHNGVVVADTHRPVIVYETGVNPRYYIPPADVRLDLMQPADRTTSCPYKGFSAYWSVLAGDDELLESAWSYPTPLPEASLIAGMLSFYTNRFLVEVDGVRLTT